MDGISENGSETSFRNGDGGVVNFVWGDDDAGLWNGSLGSSGDVWVGFRNGDDGDWVESMSALVETLDGELQIVYWPHILDDDIEYSPLEIKPLPPSVAHQSNSGTQLPTALTTESLNL